MAEFCVKCWNKMNGVNYPPEYYVVSKDLDLCEGCGNYEHVIIDIKTTYRVSNPFMPLIELVSLLIFGVYKIFRKLFSLFKK